MTIPIYLDALEKMAKDAASEYEDAQLIRYDHGGGRLVVIDREDASLIADLYEKESREFIFAANPATVLALIARLRAAEAVVEAARACDADYEPMLDDMYRPQDDLIVALSNYDDAVAGREGAT